MTQCAENIYGGRMGLRNGGQCTRPGKVEIDGNLYCTQHGKKRLAAKATQEKYANWTPKGPATA